MAESGKRKPSWSRASCYGDKCQAYVHMSSLPFTRGVAASIPIDPWVVQVVLSSFNQQDRQVSVKGSQTAGHNTAGGAPFEMY